ncbi:MAG TPA: hypothetical protein VKV15_22590 [Bryobacteraceae bacterium]|nr:hypothetical protein [Bryobacteraceae bacterium]
MRMYILLFTCIAALAQTSGPKAGTRPPSSKSVAGSPTNDVDAIIELVKSGMPESLVVKTIQKSGKSYQLAPADVLRLRKAGVGNKVIEAMMDASGAASSGPIPRSRVTANRPPSSPAGDREPTEQEMYAALKAGFDNANSYFKEKEAACRSGAYKRDNDPALAMMCLAGALGTGGRGGLRVNISGFQKIACSRASGQAGWNCDYAAAIDTPGLAASPTMRELAQNQVMHARFVYTGGQWIRLQ